MLEDSQVGNKGTPLQITEDEAAVYDRQIRLWGLEAQQRMRNATIMIVRLRGVATETIKNIVLAGIGKLVVADDAVVSEEDLGAGFFFQEEDIGMKRVDAAKSKIESLNPLVEVVAVPTISNLDPASLPKTLLDIDLICICDSDQDTLIRVNAACRAQNKPFYAGGCYGLIGYIFADLIEHDYLAADTLDPKDPGKKTKRTISYVPLESALKPYSWEKLTRVQTKELNPAAVFSVLALWQYQSSHQGKFPANEDDVLELGGIADQIFSAANVNRKVLSSMPRDILKSLCTTASHEFSPVCAVVGGLLAQDILKALSKTEAPIANFFVFDGYSGHGSVSCMNMSRA